MSKKEELKEQVETEALMDAEVEAATDCGCCCSTKSKKEGPLTVDSAEVKL